MAEVDGKKFNVSRSNLDLPQDSGDVKKDIQNIKQPADKVVKGDVTLKKKSGIQKVAETFLGGDIRDVVSYVVKDVLVPAGQKMLYETIAQGTERLIYGETAPDRARQRNRGITSYAKYYEEERNRDRRRDPVRPVVRRGDDFDDILLQSREDAEDVLRAMQSRIEDYGQCTVADLYYMVGRSPAATDYNWGWTDLRKSSYSHIRDGYVLNLPRTEDLR